MVKFRHQIRKKSGRSKVHQEMSPVPPVSGATSHHNGNVEPAQYNHDSNHSKQEFQRNEEPTNVVSNGVQEAPHKGETEKVKRGRPAKSEGKQNGAIKKRGRPPKVKSDDVPSKQSKITDTLKKAKRTVNRFKDVTKEELMARFLPDRIKPNLDILIIGINPGLFAAYKGHHYAGPGNHFWSCLNMSGFVDRKMTSENDVDLLDYGIGFSTIVQRTTPAMKDLSSKEIREGAKKLIEKIQQYKPKIAVFNGKGIYEIFSKEIFGQKKKDFVFGTQENRIPGTDTYIFVMASSSARCAQFPRAQDKVHFYIKMKQLRDGIKGVQSDAPVCEVSYSFDLKKATELAKVQNIKQEKFDPEYEAKGETTSSFPMFSGTLCNAASSGEGNSKTQPAGGAAGPSDVNNNGGAGMKQAPPRHSGATTQASNNNNNAITSNMDTSNRKEDTDVSLRHSHLIRYLRQDDSVQEPGPSHGNKATPPLTLSPANPKLQQDVSEEQRQERVGNWVREQQSLDYDTELPMGIDEGADTSSGQDGASAAGVEIDRASQLSAISAGISGSASESTSGYGSIDASSRRVRLDRVEMWVLEQQHALRHNQVNQHIQQSIQAALPTTSALTYNGPSTSGLADNQQNAPRFQQPPGVGWLQHGVPLSYPYAPPVATSPTVGGGRKSTPNSSIQVNMSVDQGAGPSVTLTSTPSASGGRNSPYRINRTLSRREGGSVSSFGTTVRPPVPLYSSWGGEGSNSGGSGVSSPMHPFVTTPSTLPNPTQTFNGNSNNNNTNPQTISPSNYPIGLNMGWQPLGGNNLLAPFYNM